MPQAYFCSNVLDWTTYAACFYKAAYLFPPLPSQLVSSDKLLLYGLSSCVPVEQGDTNPLACPIIGTACKMSVASCFCTACYICWGMTMSWGKKSQTQWHSRSRTSCKASPGRFAPGRPQKTHTRLLCTRTVFRECLHEYYTS